MLQGRFRQKIRVEGGAQVATQSRNVANCVYTPRQNCSQILSLTCTMSGFLK
jgi:hypothetical protein